MLRPAQSSLSSLSAGGSLALSLALLSCLLPAPQSPVWARPVPYPGPLCSAPGPCPPPPALPPTASARGPTRPHRPCCFPPHGPCATPMLSCVHPCCPTSSQAPGAGLVPLGSRTLALWSPPGCPSPPAPELVLPGSPPHQLAVHLAPAGPSPGSHSPAQEATRAHRSAVSAAPTSSRPPELLG